jgi:hypothetical protein
MDAIEKIKRINDDFVNKNGPFANVTFPEERLLEEIKVEEDGETWSLTMEDKLAAVSLFATLDYNRDANQLVDKIVEAADNDAVNIFNPHEIEKSKKSAEYLFEEVSFRYPQRDAHAWHKNCSILVEQYNGKWHELLLSVGCDAPTLVKQVNDDDFNCLKGVKIAPMYARIINDEVCPMSNLWNLDIPVDIHIRQLSNKLADGGLEDDDDIRAWWGVIGQQADIDLHTVDGGLWHIGNNWDDWGEEYWDSL